MNNEFSITNQFERAAQDINRNLPPRQKPQPQVRQPYPQPQTPQYQQPYPNPQPPYRPQYQQPSVPLYPAPIPIEDKIKKWSLIVLVILILGTATILVISTLLGRFF